MPPEVVDSPATAQTEAPSYSPPANEPQGLEPEKAAPDAKEEKVEAKEGAIKLPASIKPPQKTGRFQERISDLVSQRDTMRREAETLREENARLKSQGKAPVTDVSQIGKTENADGLNPEDFPTYGEYITALVKNTLGREKESEKSQQAQRTYEQHKQERMTAFNTHASPLAQQYGDGFWDTITDPTLPINEPMADAIMELDELGPYTMLYLAAHKDEAAKIAAMNPRAATVAIGRLAAQLDQEIKGGGGQVQNAPLEDSTQTNQMGTVRPSPIPTPRGSTPSLATAPSDKDTVDEWLRKETDRLRRINPNAKFYGAR